jgi:hypothetical protein
MTREERIKLARQSLWTEHSKQLFDELIKLYPQAAIFWECGDEKECVNFQFKEGSIISIAGYN